MNTENQKPEVKNNIATPLAIIIAGVLVAGAVIYTGGDASLKSARGGAEVNPIEKVRPVNSSDHIRGNPNASVVIVEYSDFECPYCKSFHTTMKQVMDEFGESGEVAWVYRHFPIEQLHPVKAYTEAIVSECVAELGGNDAFWKFADRFYELTPSNNRTDIDVVLPQIVNELGISVEAVDECIKSEKHDERVQNDFQNAFESGGEGTPWSIVIAPNGKKFPLSGSQSYATVKQLIEIALKEK